MSIDELFTMWTAVCVAVWFLLIVNLLQYWHVVSPSRKGELQTAFLIPLREELTTNWNSYAGRETQVRPTNFISSFRRLGFIVHDVPRDGNCLFAAAADHLSRICPQGVYTASRLRRCAVTYLTRHPVSAHTNTLLSEFLTNETWDDYLQRMSQDHEWGDHLTLTALAEWLQSRILIYHENVFHPTVVEPHSYISASRRQRNYRRTITLGLVGSSHYVSLEALTTSDSTDFDDTSDTSSDTDTETEEGFHMVSSCGVHILVGDSNTQHITANIPSRVQGGGHQTFFNMVVGKNSQHILHLNVQCLIKDGAVNLIKDMLDQQRHGSGTAINIKIIPLGLNDVEEAEYAKAEISTIKKLREERRSELEKDILPLGGRVIEIDNGCIEIVIAVNNWKRVAKFAQHFYDGRFERAIETVCSSFPTLNKFPEMLRVTMDIRRSPNHKQDKAAFAIENTPKCMDEIKTQSTDASSESNVSKPRKHSGIQFKIIPTADFPRSHEGGRCTDSEAIRDHAKTIAKRLLYATEWTSLTTDHNYLDIGVSLSKEDDVMNEQPTHEMSLPDRDEVCSTSSLKIERQVCNGSTDRSPSDNDNETHRQDEASHNMSVVQFTSMPDMRQYAILHGRSHQSRWFAKRLRRPEAKENLLPLMQKVQTSIGLLIGGKKPYGNCFRIGKNYILTCYHVLKCLTGDGINEVMDVELSIFFGSKTINVAARLVFKSESLDVVLLNIKTEVPLSAPLSRITHVFPGDPFYIVGRHSGTKKTIVGKSVFMNTMNTFGYDMPFDTRTNITFQTESFGHGTSGSPCIILKHDRTYVGAMLVGGYSDESDSGAMVQYGVRMSAVYDRIMEENPELGDNVFFPRILNPAEEEFNRQAVPFN